MAEILGRLTETIERIEAVNNEAAPEDLDPKAASIDLSRLVPFFVEAEEAGNAKKLYDLGHIVGNQAFRALYPAERKLLDTWGSVVNVNSDAFVVDPETGELCPLNNLEIVPEETIESVLDTFDQEELTAADVLRNMVTAQVATYIAGTDFLFSNPAYFREQ